MEPKKADKVNLEKSKLTFVLVGLALSLSITLFAFELKSTEKVEIVEKQDLEDVIQEEAPPVTEQIEEPEIIEPEEVPEIADVLEVKEDDEELTNEIIVENEDISENTEVEIEIEEEVEAVEEEVFVIVENMPSFQGGDLNNFRKWVFNNMKYPESAREMGISGTVVLQFVVDSKGNVTKIKVVRPVDPALDEEAKRVVASSPKWQAGSQRGKNVSVQFFFPIKFVLQ